jgi:hypothetical protein
MDRVEQGPYDTHTLVNIQRPLSVSILLLMTDILKVLITEIREADQWKV